MICPNCGKEFTPHSPKQKYCSKTCGQLWWAKTHQDKVKAANARFAASTRGKEARRQAMARYRATEKGALTHRVATARYRASEKGWFYVRLDSVRTHAKRRCLDPEAYIAAFRRLLYEQHSPCANCGRPWERSHLLDHIIPLALGGRDEEANYQVLCVECHKAKTRGDLSRINKAQRGIAK